MNIPAISRFATPVLAATCLMAWVHTSPAADEASIVILPDADTRIMNPKWWEDQGRPERPEPEGEKNQMGVYTGRDRSLIQFALSDSQKRKNQERYLGTHYFTRHTEK